MAKPSFLVVLVVIFLTCHVQRSSCQQNTNTRSPPRNKSQKNPRKSRKQQQSSSFHQQDTEQEYFSQHDAHDHQKQNGGRHQSNPPPKSENDPPSWNEFMREESTSKALRVILNRPKPRGVLHAAWRATKSTALEFLLGATSFFTFPVTTLVLGNYNWKAIAASFALGGTMGLAAIAYGIWNGICQCVWGVLQTPKALESLWADSVWDPSDGTWKIYNMPEHANELLEKQLSKAGDPSSYYQLLEVPITATKSEIKRAYYAKAKKWHPDKNPDGSMSSEKFLFLHIAYETLADDRTRASYNERGEDAQQKAPLDPNVFFSVLFDYHSMRSYTGDLAISSWSAQLVDLGVFATSSSNEDDPIKNFRKLVQLVAESTPRAQKRHVDIAMHLANTIKPYVAGTMEENEFRAWCRQEARKILEKATFDDASELLMLLGKALQQTAAQHRSFHRLAPFGWPRGLLVWSRKSFSSWSKKLQFYAAAFQLIKQITKDAKFLKRVREPQKEAIVQERLQAMLPLIMRLAGHFNGIDIAATVDGACWKLFRDSSVSKSNRYKRSKAVRILGEEFSRMAHGSLQTKSDGHIPGQEDVDFRVEFAFYATQANMEGHGLSDLRERLKNLKQRVPYS